ncbi:MAG TPA: C-GCAxxG-C-C family protein [Bacteroidota bacterium]|nr:C-GCAxxG-C-C family protein [Bacteroidota bacterium]
MNQTTEAVKLFSSGFNCAQSVFVPYAEEAGLPREQAFKLSCGFGAGKGRQQKTCGAVTGSYMVIGLKHGKYQQEDNPAREKTYSLVKEFSKQFIKKNKTLECSELLHCDLNTEEGNKYFQEHQLHNDVCVKCVTDANNILNAILEE